MIKKATVEGGVVVGAPAADPRIFSFKGIPFAAPPVGENRWRAPQPVIPWEGEKECYIFKPISMQHIPGLDQNNIGIFRDVLMELKRKNKIILLSSHQYQPIQDTCDRYMYLKNGELVINETRAHLNEMPQRIVEIEHNGSFLYQGKEATRTIVCNSVVKMWVNNEQTAWIIIEKVKNDPSVTSVRKRKLTINDLIEVVK